MLWCMVWCRRLIGYQRKAGLLRFGLADLSEKRVCRGKANTATTAFARSHLPRSLLIAHSVAAAVGFVGVSDGGFERVEIA